MGAEEYLAYDAPRGMYWGYWDAPDAWWTDQYPFGMYVAKIGDTVRFAFQTDHGQLVIGGAPPVAVARAWRGNPAAALQQLLAQDPVTGPLLRDATPPASIRGTIKERYFFRQADGPGWALVGDAGHHKDFVIGDGITEALIQAKDLAAAIGTGKEADLLRWWRKRDVKALPAFYWGKEEGAPVPVSELETLIIGNVGKRKELCYLIARLLEHQCSPYDALPPRIVLPWLFAALLRGRRGIIPQFLGLMRRTVEYRREMRQRTALTIQPTH